jgi:RimJ/RimL family protein N-acetyltransferase
VQLTTPRLILREMTPEDAPALHAVLGDEETMRFYPRPFTPPKSTNGSPAKSPATPPEPASSAWF